jgi:hypothetical protein
MGNELVKFSTAFSVASASDKSMVNTFLVLAIFIVLGLPDTYFRVRYLIAASRAQKQANCFASHVWKPDLQLIITLALPCLTRTFTTTIPPFGPPRHTYLDACPQ